jgi:hypothetical protein
MVAWVGFGFETVVLFGDRTLHCECHILSASAQAISAEGSAVLV